MATDGPDPTPCEPEIFKKGQSVFVTDSISSNRMESWVKEVAKHSGQRVDWHFFGGRANVLALGDLDAVKSSIQHLMPMHDRLRQESLARYDSPHR
jgi:hypothetical protein